MSLIIKIFRISFFLILYFIMCMVAVTAMLQNWPNGGQMLFAFGVPAILVWWQEKRRSRKAVVSVTDEFSDEQNSSLSGIAIETGGNEVLDVPTKLPEVAEARILEGEPDSVRRDRQALRAQRLRAEEYQRGQNERRMARQRDLDEKRRQDRAQLQSSQSSDAIAQKAPTPQQDGWVSFGETASVAGRDIGGMIYVGTPLILNNNGYRQKCRAYIDPSLSVAHMGSDKAGDGMPYWPGYSDISPQCRAT